MCLAVPGKIIKIKDDIATVDYELETRIGKLIETGYAVGDYVIIQGSIIVAKVEEQQAREALQSYKESMTE